jgi:hypothetical protein
MGLFWLAAGEMKRIASMPRLPFDRALRAAVTGVSLSATVLLATAPVSAQEIQPLLPKEDVPYCLCLEQEIAEWQSELDVRGSILNERQSELQRLDMDIEVKRAAMTPGDEMAIADLKAMIERQQSLRALLRRDIMPSYQAAVQGYNAATDEYNARCAGRRFFQPEVDALQGTLQCPKRE